MITDEETVVMIKPDVITRGLVGRVIQRFEDAGMQLKQVKEHTATRALLEQHYMKDQQWMELVGLKTLNQFKSRGLSTYPYLKSTNPLAIGRMIYEWNIEAVVNKEVIVLLLSGPHAIERVKQIVGVTEPIEAGRGTIRGDFCTDSVIYSTSHRRGISNLVHRSSNPQEVAREKRVWFS